ncbi:FmdE family protein [Paenibacillus sanguinis]|uniref:FmdE family protein n=1 Tax=Paenibacillus sanguinis TaxID=225906 RepID=UPI00035C5965|nr:FmdE family protein [Paenibacillus sanguinis]
MTSISVKEGQEILILTYEDLCKYHGGGALMALAVGFRMQQTAFAELYPGEVPQRRSFSIRSGHAGPGFRDAFEYVTRAYTRGAYMIDTSEPEGQYDPYREQSYAFTVTGDNGRAVQLILRPDFLPKAFFDYMKQGRDGRMTVKDDEAFADLRLELSERALALPASELLIVRRLV